MADSAPEHSRVEVRRPTDLCGGKVSGSLFMDFWAGAGTSLNQIVRLRVASLDFSWPSTTFSVGQDKPIIAPREPTSLAQVGVSPLTGAGNLWLWEPQARVEQRFHFGDQSGLRAQVGVYQTSESYAFVPTDYVVSAARPALEGRFEFWHQFGGDRRIEIAPGFHVSESHIEGTSVPSRVASIDWLIRPLRILDFTGTFFSGENTAVLGGLRQGISFELLRPDQTGAARPADGRSSRCEPPAGFHSISTEAKKILGIRISSSAVSERIRRMRGISCTA